MPSDMCMAVICLLTLIILSTEGEVRSYLTASSGPGAGHEAVPLMPAVHGSSMSPVVDVNQGNQCGLLQQQTAGGERSDDGWWSGSIYDATWGSCQWAWMGTKAFLGRDAVYGHSRL